EGVIEVARGFIDCSVPGLVGAQDLNKAEPISTNVLHFQDFYDGVLKGKELLCPAETGHRSASVCTLTNIAYRLGRPLLWDPVKERVRGDRMANRLLGPAYRLSLG
ncbi:MAG: gfo/Idh/MocA family oxidoreductase, partial [Bacteroidota bacterium]